MLDSSPTSRRSGGRSREQEIDMEDAAATARQRLARWIEDSREVFALLPELLDGVQKASAKTEHAEREAERLRRELMGLRKELTDARDKETGGRAQHGELEKQLEELKRINEELRGEKEEAAQAFAKLLETVQSTNQRAQKLDMTKSAFARTQPAEHARAVKRWLSARKRCGVCSVAPRRGVGRWKTRVSSLEWMMRACTHGPGSGTAASSTVLRKSG